MSKGDLAYLRHIHDAIEHIERYVASVSKEEFLEHEMRQDAVIRQLSIIGDGCFVEVFPIPRCGWWVDEVSPKIRN